jgi:RTX calcium-binding nonapeptide repeat (4 copies)
MPQRQPIVRALIARAVIAVAIGSGVTGVPQAAHAAPGTCQEKAVTIVATRTVTRGTEGDDVVAMEPEAWNVFDALGGNDTICLAAPALVTTDHYGGQSQIGSVDAGTGDDVVVNLTPPGTRHVMTTVVLGLGNDTFEGADVGETVHAEPEHRAPDAPMVDGLVGAQRDTITGAATVYSAAPYDGPNADRIVFGTQPAKAVLDGRLSPAGLLDFSAASEAALELPVPAGLRLGSPDDVVVDNVTRTVDVGGTALTWNGDIDTFAFGYHTRGASARVSFRGTDRDELVTFADVRPGDVSLGGGDDTLYMRAYNNTWVPTSADGGSGDDAAYLDAVCRDVFLVRVGRMATCDGVSGSFTDFREVVIRTDVPGSATTVVGTGRSERLVAGGHASVVRGGAGRDEIQASGSSVQVSAGPGGDRVFADGGSVTVRAGAGRDKVLVDALSARVDAGPGPDRLVAESDDVVLRGQGGSDRLVLRGPSSEPQPPGAQRRRVALGGRGNDVLVGATDKRPDTLIGGAGRDRADGREGRDRCAAEVRRSCEEG